jgi:hypothetical protein
VSATLLHGGLDSSPQVKQVSEDIKKLHAQREIKKESLQMQTFNFLIFRSFMQEKNGKFPKFAIVIGLIFLRM